MFLTLFFLFTLVPALELYLLFQVGSVIGILETVAVIVITGIAGAYLARTQGQYLFLQVNKKLSKGEMPADEGFQGLLVFIGGVLLITPGFITDVFGILMVLPLTRKLFLKFLKSYFLNKIKTGKVHVHTHASQFHTSKQWQNTYPQEKVIRDVSEVNVIDVTPKKD